MIKFGKLNDKHSVEIINQGYLTRRKVLTGIPGINDMHIYKKYYVTQHSRFKSMNMAIKYDISVQGQLYNFIQGCLGILATHFVHSIRFDFNITGFA